MPGIPFKSQLEPHYQFIVELRSVRRKTWGEIAEDLKVRGIATSAQAVFAFYKRRQKRRAPLGWEVPPAGVPGPSQASNTERSQAAPAALPPGDLASDPLFLRKTVEDDVFRLKSRKPPTPKP